MYTKKTIRKNLSLWLIIITFSTFGLIGCTLKADEKEAGIPAPVRAQTVSQSAYSSEAEYFGTIESENLKRYSFLNGGRIESIPVSLGTVVSKGMVLATLESKDYVLSQKNAETAYIAAKSAYEFADSNYENTKKLFEEGAISQNELDISKQKKNQAESALASANASYSTQDNALKNTVLRAEEIGVVVTVSFEVGETVSVGIPVVVVSSGNQKAKVGVSIEDVDKIKTGTEVRLVETKNSSDSGSLKELEGIIKNVGSLPDMATRTYPVEIEVKNGQFLLGSFVNIYIPIGKKIGTIVPISAILDDGESYVFLVDKDGKAEKRSVEIKQILDMEVVVTGLNEGEQLITEGMKNIEAGRKVQVK